MSKCLETLFLPLQIYPSSTGSSFREVMPGGRDAATSSLARADRPGGSTRPRLTQDTGGLALWGLVHRGSGPIRDPLSSI